MIIRGNFVKSSNIRLTECPLNQISRINVYVVSTFYVDSDLNLIGFEELKIFANKWYILHVATFHLNGLNGEPHERNDNGMPGNPGMDGGNFFGLANEIINGDLLTVNVNGGNGANGQDGISYDDVEVEFNEREHKTTSAFDTESLDSYYLRYFQEKGYYVELIQSASFLRYYAVVATGSGYYQKFRLYPARCCGKTGVGSSGKKWKTFSNFKFK